MRKVKQKGQEVNVGKVLSHITTKYITEVNNLIRAAAFVVGRSLGIKKGRTKGAPKEPPCKQKQKKQIDERRKDISRLNCILRKEPVKWRVQVTLDHKHKTKEKGFQDFLEELKQRVTAKAAKRRRYENRVKQFWQNRLFDSDQTRLFEELDGKLEEKTPHQAPMKV